MAATLRTHVGKVRKQNEDAAWFDEKLAVFAVADGMGGHQAGEVASMMAIDAVQKMAKANSEPGIALMRDTVRRAHEAMIEHANRNPACAGMGTTLSLMWKRKGYMYIAHVGDSRIYRMRDGVLEQITEDHSLVAEFVRNGLITPEEARVHPRRNIITRALGTAGDCEPDILATDTQPGDIWLLCSDGLSGMVEDAEIERVLSRGSIDKAADTLLKLALRAGGRDNITLILYKDEEAQPWNRD